MVKTKSTKRALLMSALSLLLCISMLIGTTFAWFTDSVTSGRNTIQSGNLDVVLEYKDGDAWKEVTPTTELFTYDNWEPGYTKVVRLKVTNKGSLALKYQLSADVYVEEPGTNVAGKEFLLSDYLYTKVVDANATRDQILASTDGLKLKNSYMASDASLAAGASKEVALAIWMPTTVGNEANHNGDAPKIEFGVNLIATQEMSEADSFGSDYDAQAIYPEELFVDLLTGGAVVEDGVASYEIDLLRDTLNDDGDHSKGGSITIPAEAVDPNATALEVVVKKLHVADDSVKLENDQKAITYDISVVGIKDGNNAPIKVSLNVGKGIVDVVLYHKAVKVNGAVYNASTGHVTFETTSFSPFTVVYDLDPNAPTDFKEPEAIVVDADTYEDVVLDWTGFGGLNPGNSAQTLDAVYKFTAPHDSDTVRASAYKDWHCDYYVMLKSDKIATLPEGTITLGGNYGSFGWVGFDNPEVPANEWIPLLGSVTQNPWTYEEIVGFVGEFLCGVGKTGNNADALDGASFVVQLRLTNPENENDIVVANETVHSFAVTEVADQAGLGAALANGAAAVQVPAGTYTVPASVAGKDVTIIGTGEDTVFDFTTVNTVSGASVTFENVKITGVNANALNGYGIQSTNGNITYKNCTFENAVTNEHYGNVTYIDCKFVGTYYITTYAVKSATFVNCEFDRTDSRALLVYSHGDNPVKVTVENCTFKAAAKGYTWHPQWTAAVEVDTTNIPSAGTTVTIKNCTYDENYNGIVRDKSAAGKETAVITVNGVVVNNATIKDPGYAG